MVSLWILLALTMGACGKEQDMEPNYEVCRILNWDVTENGRFYYQVLKADHTHYEDYTMI